MSDTAGDFAEAVRTRVLRARSQLGEAAARKDGPGVSSAVDELEDALAMARANGVAIPAADEAADGNGAQGR